MLEAVAALFAASSEETAHGITTNESNSLQCNSADAFYNGVLAGDIFSGAFQACAVERLNLEPLRILEEFEIHANTTDVDFVRQVDAVMKHEKTRRSTVGRTANEVAFPLPDGYGIRHHKRRDPLWGMYEKAGTWDLNTLSVAESLAARRSVARQVCSPPERALVESQLRDGLCTPACTKAESTRLEGTPCDFEVDEDAPFVDEFAELTYEEVVALENKEWHLIASTKETERDVWGGFEESEFPLLHRVWNCDESEGLKPALLRADVHADDSCMITSIDGLAAWEVKPKILLPQISKDIWEFNASGGFCLREANVTGGLNHIEPADDWECVICLGDSKKSVVAIGCSHVFHEGCIAKWLGRSRLCPLCRAKCRDGPSCCNEPMEFELTPWTMLPEGVIANDACTESQERVAIARRERQLSTEAIASRRQRLAERFKCKPPHDTFFEELRPEDTSLIGPDAVLARSRQFREEVATEVDRLALAGQQLTIWPVDRRWPIEVEMDSRIINQRNEIRKRLETRYWRRRCRSSKGLAMYLLKQCYSLSLEE